MLSKQDRPASRAVLWYAALGGAWIYFSDRLLSATVGDPAVLLRVAMYKGWIFVALSAMLVFILMRSYSRLSERAIASLAESEDRYRSIYEASLDGILYTQPDGSVLSANPAACRILGRTEAEIRALDRGGQMDADSSHFSAALETRRRTGQWSGQLAFRRGDGTRFVADVSTSIFTDTSGQARANVIFRDDSVRLATLESLRRAEEAEHALIECSPVALYSLDFEGTVLSWNPAAQRIFGWSADEVLGRQIPNIPEDQKREYGQLLSRMRGGEFFTAREMVRQRRGGALFDASLSTAPIKDAQGRTVAIMAAVEDITERKHAERALRANEERYRGIFENHGAPMLLIKPSDGRIVDANPAAAHFYGWSREWLRSMHIGDINSLSADQLQTEMQQARTQRRHSFRFQHLLADGTQRWVDVYSSPVKVDGETLLYSIIHDVSRLYETEVALARSNRLHALLAETNHLITRATDRDKLATDVCELAVTTGGFRFAWIGRGEPDGTLRPVARAGDSGGLLESSSELRHDATAAARPAQRAFATGTRVVVNDRAHFGTAELRAMATRAGIESVASFPLPEHGRTTGTLTFFSGEPEFFTDAELSTLDIVASDLTFGLELLAQRGERRALEEELRKAERRWRFALEGAGHGVMEWDLVTNETFFSPAWSNMLGQAAGDATSTIDEWFLRIHPEDVTAVRQALEHHLTGQEPMFKMEHRLRHRDGTYRWVVCRAAVTGRAADGRPQMLVATHTDVTLRHVAEERLALKERRAQTLLALPAEAEACGEVEFMQRAVHQAEELTGSCVSFVHLVNPDEDAIELVTWSQGTMDRYCRAVFDRHFPVSQAGVWADAVRTRQPVVLNDYPSYPGKRGLPAGHAELRRFISIPVIDHGRVVMLVGVGNKAEPYDADDVESVQLFANAIWRIVRHARDLDALRADQARIHRVLDATPDLVFVNRDDHVVAVNPAGLLLLRKSREQVIGHPVFELFHPDSHDLVRQRIAELREIPGLSMPPIRERLLATDGSVIVADVSAVSYLNDGFVDIQVTVRPVHPTRNGGTNDA